MRHLGPFFLVFPHSADGLFDLVPGGSQTPVDTVPPGGPLREQSPFPMSPEFLFFCIGNKTCSRRFCSTLFFSTKRNNRRESE